MAATILNTQIENLARGRPRIIPGFTATTQAFQFSVSQNHVPPNGLDVLNASVVGGTSTTGLALECSLDGGVSFFGIAARGNQTFNTTVIGGDPAAVAAVSYDVSGLSNAMFRIGVTGITAGSATVALLLG